MRGSQEPLRMWDKSCLELGYQCFRAFELSYCLLLDLELASFQPGTYSICSSGLSTLDWA